MSLDPHHRWGSERPHDFQGFKELGLETGWFIPNPTFFSTCAAPGDPSGTAEGVPPGLRAPQRSDVVGGEPLGIRTRQRKEPDVIASPAESRDGGFSTQSAPCMDKGNGSLESEGLQGEFST